MPIIQEYAYRAVDATGGGVVKGTIEAAGEGAVTSKLRAQGLTPLEVTLVSKTGLNMELSIPGFERGVKVKSLAVFSTQMAGLINAGLPLLRTLTILSEQTTDKKLQGAIISVHADVESGSAFSAALAAHGDVFPPLMVNVIRVGETGGFLGAAMESIARTYTNEAELQNKIRAAVTYPIIVLVIAIVGVIAMVTFVVPVFSGMFVGLGSQLPVPTQILVGISANMWWILPLLFLCVVGLWLVWRRERHSDRYRRVVDPLKLKMPVFGTMITKIAVARFARNLSMMLDAGVPLVQGLDVVGKASNNWAIEQAVHGIQESIRDGKSFSAPLAKAAVFPTMVAQMVAVGEESGTLSQMLASIADYYEKEVETATSQLTSVIEPILIVGIGLIIGGMVVTLYLPIFTIYGELSRQ